MLPTVLTKKGYRAKQPAKQIQNPNIEIRNKLRDKINLKSGKSKTPNPKEACLEFYIFRSFEIVSNFGFRASNFLFFAPLRESQFFHLALANYLYRALKHLGRNCHSDLFGGLEIDREIEFGRLDEG